MRRLILSILAACCAAAAPMSADAAAPIKAKGPVADQVFNKGKI